MNKGELYADQPVELAIETEQGTRWGKTRVIDIRRAGIALLAVPILDGEGVPVRAGTDTLIMMTTSQEAFSVRASVIARELEPIPGLVVQVTGRPVRTQRREYVRIPCAIEVEMAWATDRLRPHIVRTTATDISGGGIKLKLHGDACPPPGTPARIAFFLPDTEAAYNIQARIPWANGSRARGWTIGVDFGPIPNAMRSAILAFCVAKQRDLIARGVLRRGE